MILDQLKNLDVYKALGTGDRYVKAVEWLKSNDLANLPDGHYEIDGKEVYAGVMSYTTVPWEEAVYEAHKKYTDIHCIVSGTEILTYAPVSALVPSNPYNPEKDSALFDSSCSGIRVPCYCGDCMIFFPWDGHKPKTENGAPSKVKKVVVKILESGM